MSDTTDNPLTISVPEAGKRYFDLALQLSFFFEVSALSGGLVSSSPE